jgi:beta-lactamase class A
MKRHFALISALLLSSIFANAQQRHHRIGMNAILLETHDSASFHGEEHFPMQSVYKFPIAMAVLHAVDENKMKLEQSVQVLASDLTKVGHSPLRDAHPGGCTMTLKELLRYNIAESDGSACDVLIRLMGGTTPIDNYVKKLGVQGMSIATTEKVQQMDDTTQYRNYSSPEAMTQLLKIFYTQPVLSAKSRAFLLDLMVTSTPGPKRIKGQLPAGTVVAHKTGTSGKDAEGFTAATNDVGVITLPGGHHIAVSIFVSDSDASEEAREAAIASITKELWDKWKDK